MKTPFRLAVATRCLNLPIRQAIPRVVDMGAEGFQVDVRNEMPAGEWGATAIRDLLHYASEHSVTLHGTSFALRTGLFDLDMLERRTAAIKEAIEFSSRLKARTLCLRMGRLPAAEDASARAVMFDVLDQLARAANHYGVIVCLGPQGDAPATLLDVLSQVNSGPVQLDFDAAAFAMAGQPVPAALRELHQLVSHFTLRDGIKEMDGGVEVPVGQGAVKWLETIATLGEMSYRGWMTAVRNQGDQKQADLERAIKTIRKLAMGGMV